jgi:hypothetical protein
MDKQIFIRGMAILAAGYPDYPLKDETMDLYWEFLQKMDNLTFERAVKGHISTSKWFPKISELMEAYKNQQPTPLDTWSRLIAAAEVGTKPEMDKATERALRFIGGWEQFCITSYDALQYRFKDFREAYLEAREQDERYNEITHKPLPQLEG